ncbi:PH domain-containing protein [uncultured Subdoligranulum sp.]|uniref:PH domain-containing protein n=1 Tax=Candidatus Gemmiger excrementavium TaxID=2838608 RepID=A0A9D2JGZ2_9FIRM|nr:PH domain-containing protein [uncultured Subdoligranulum sp.]HIZ48279.1 PH domain-containing protein [Candidatus Gemmiger excrementavium]
MDLENRAFLKLRPVQDGKLAQLVQPMLLPQEQVLQQYQGIRDGVVFTDRRLIAVNTQGVTGKKKMYAVLPYTRIQAYAVESAGVLDFDSEMQLWFSGLGCVTLELLAGADLFALSRLMDQAILR